ncbi:MAG: rRNA (cytosine-C5-)-methyltransferase nop2 [Chrysothrix sp. TS-e1954]|nr:MAG: rRNA (cytosine-C5-)-methyltransferase nop2 [Chrysothrix sp. TS-e1954]
MGPSRRMQKQGVPPPLDEALVSRKRKTAPTRTEPPSRKKSKAQQPNRTPSAVNGAVTNGHSRTRPTTATAMVSTKTDGRPQTGAVKRKKVTGPKKSDVVVEAKADPGDGFPDSDDGVDDPDIMEDEFDTQEVDRLDAEESSADSVSELDEDILGSDSDVLDSDQDTDGRKPIWSDEESDDDAAETLKAANIEGLSQQLDAKAAREAADAQAELEEAALQTNIADDAETAAALDGDDSDSSQTGVKTRIAPNLQLLRTRITDTLRALDDVSAHTTKTGRSRADFIAQLLKDISVYYGYAPFLAEKLFNLFSPREAFAFFEANETPRPVVIRTNTLKTHRRDLAQSLINRGVNLEPVGKWSKVGLQIFESAVPLGATPEYLAGHYILQAASSFLPVMALAPQEHERILDMASAPGGKTTHMAALMKNTGCIFANDQNRSRAKALIGNVHRLGTKNTIICSYDAREFPRVIGGFDRVLLDAPCSGTGVIGKDASVKTNKTPSDFLRLPHLQKQLLLCAIDSVDHASKSGGYIVYSTCSVTVEENEQVVQYALSRRPNVKLVETGLVLGKDGFTSYMAKKFDDSMKLTKRFYPHVYNVDGFFVSKFKKTGPTPENAKRAMNSAAESLPQDQTADDAEVEAPAPKPVRASVGREDSFSGFDDSEDEKIMEKARRSALRKKGLNPNADKSKAGEKKQKANATLDSPSSQLNGDLEASLGSKRGDIGSKGSKAAPASGAIPVRGVGMEAKKTAKIVG